jgi:hypothetical protein
MEYVTELLIELFYEEIAIEEPGLLLSHALMKVMVKDYLRTN